MLIRAPAVGSKNLGAAPPHSPARKWPTTAPSISLGKLRPGEEQCFVQGHALELEARSPALCQVPRGAPFPSIPPGVLQPGGAARTQRADREGTAGGAGPPYLDDGRAGGGGGGGVRLWLRVARLPPSPGAQSHRLLPRQPGASGASGRGRGPAQAPPARPAGATPPFLPTPAALLAPGGWSPGAPTRTEQARTPARTRRSDWGGLPGDQAAAGDSPTRLASCPAAPSLRGTERGTRSPGASVSTFVKWKQ